MPKYNIPQSVYPASNSSNRNTKKPYTKPSKKKEQKPLPTSLSQCKRQIRDTTRLLSRTNLSSTQRQEIERRHKALEVLQTKLTNIKADKANANRYSGVRFIERKKIQRKLEKQEDKEDKEDTEDLLVRLNYVVFFPDELKYMSLYPADPENTKQETKDRQQDILGGIRIAMDEDRLPKDARELSKAEVKQLAKTNRGLLQSIFVDGEDDKQDTSEKEDSEEEDEFFN